MPRKKPSPQELLKLKKVLHVIQLRKRLTKRMYNTIIQSENIPQYIKKSITYYYKKQQSGGTPKTYIMQVKYDRLKTMEVTYESTDTYNTPIGKGGFGEIHVFQEDTTKVIKFLQLELVDTDTTRQTILASLQKKFEHFQDNFYIV